MKKDEYITEVVFRKFKDGSGIIALFPYDIYNHKGGVTSYMHVGQHSEADYTHCIGMTKPATEEEHKALKEELGSVGYNLKVIQRIDSNKYLTALKECLQS